MARKRTREVLRSLIDIALDEGYEPGRFVVHRMQDISARVGAWRYNLEKYDRLPEGFEHMPKAEFEDMLRAEESDLWKMEMQCLEYFHPKMRSSEASLSVEGVISLLELLTRERSGS